MQSVKKKKESAEKVKVQKVNSPALWKSTKGQKKKCIKVNALVESTKSDMNQWNTSS